MVTNLIAEGDFVTALGDITMKDEDGKAAHYSYCDIWHFRGGKIVELRAFVKDETSGSSTRSQSGVESLLNG